jgi:Cu2+-exporting ATPase
MDTAEIVVVIAGAAAIGFVAWYFFGGMRRGTRVTPEPRSLKVTGMNCQSCVRHVKQALEGVEGVERADVDLEAGRATVVLDATIATPEKLIAAVRDAGYEAVNER